jgi:hypothetical protein
MVASKKALTTYKPTPELDTPRYLLGDVAAAVGVSTGTLKAWLSREPHVVALGPHDQAGRGKGTPRLFTLRRIYAVAMTAELIALGFVASRAGVLGFLFTDVVMVATKKPKDTAGPFVETKGPLFLAIDRENERSFSYFGNAKFEIADFMKNPGHAYETPLISVTVIDCAALIQRVQTRLKERGVA